jgi:hypothetical protein
MDVMQHGSAIESLHEALASAVHCDLPDVEYTRREYPKREKKNYSVEEHRAHLNNYKVVTEKRRPFGSEVQVMMFEQTWGSTACGYGGIGGAAMTNAYTVLCSLGPVVCVYFGCGRLAYVIDRRKTTPEQEHIFSTAVANQSMPDVREALNKFKGAISTHGKKEGQEDVI